MTTLSLTQRDACLQHVTGLIVSHVTWATALAAFNGKDLSMVLSDAKCQYQGTSHASNVELEFRAKGTVLNVSAGNWPTGLSFEVFPLGTNLAYMEHP